MAPSVPGLLIIFWAFLVLVSVAVVPLYNSKVLKILSFKTQEKMRLLTLEIRRKTVIALDEKNVILYINNYRCIT